MINQNKPWSIEDECELIENYDYFLQNKEEAEKEFGRSWRSIQMKASYLGARTQHLWTQEEIDDLYENYRYYLQHKKEAEEKFNRSWRSIQMKASYLGITNYTESKNSSLYLGCHVAERILSHVFENVERMPITNIGYDFICSKGYKIDVKSSCLRMSLNDYTFTIKKNRIADYFLLIAFDNRDDLSPKHVWLIKSDEVIRSKKLNDLVGLVITNSDRGLSRFEKYEQSDKLEKTVACCNSRR